MATYASHSLLLNVISELSTAAGGVGNKKPEVSSLDPVEIVSAVRVGGSVLLYPSSRSRDLGHVIRTPGLRS